MAPEICQEEEAFVGAVSADLWCLLANGRGIREESEGEVRR